MHSKALASVSKSGLPVLDSGTLSAGHGVLFGLAYAHYLPAPADHLEHLAGLLRGAGIFGVEAHAALAFRYHANRATTPTNMTSPPT